MANPKKTVYVGGLTEEVDDKVLHAAFIPFGKKPNQTTFSANSQISFQVISSKYNYQLIMKLRNIVVLPLLNLRQQTMLQLQLIT